MNIFREKNKVQDYKVTSENIISGKVCPWKIVKEGLFKKRIRIKVFDLTRLDFQDLDCMSQEILGIEKDEFKRLCFEKFKVKTHYVDDCWTGYDELYFLTKSDAEQAITAFKSYYNNFYIPNIISQRLQNYSNKGYPPYFLGKNC